MPAPQSGVTNSMMAVPPPMPVGAAPNARRGRLAPPPGLFVIRPPPGLELPGRIVENGAHVKADVSMNSDTCSTADKMQGPVYDSMSSGSDTCSTADTNDSNEIVEEEALAPAVGYVPGSILYRTVNEKPPVVLQIESFLGDITEAAPGSATPELPSKGSALHSCGGCKPCEFFHRSICRAGANCSFCHLCGPQENKLRKKAKHAAMRAARLQKENTPATTR